MYTTGGDAVFCLSDNNVINYSFKKFQCQWTFSAIIIDATTTRQGTAKKKEKSKRLKLCTRRATCTLVDVMKGLMRLMIFLVTSPTCQL